MRRLVAMIAASVVLCGLTACSAPDRYAVEWSELLVSDDRQTLTVTTYYPSTGFCVKIGDGVEVDVRADEIVVSAWMRQLPGDDDDCTAECAAVTQQVTLDEPLPADLPIRPPTGYALSCGR